MKLTQLTQLKEVFQNYTPPQESPQSLKERQQAFLDYTVLFYNSNNRALEPDVFGSTVCTYYPVYERNPITGKKTETLKSPGCAIGQHITNELNEMGQNYNIDEHPACTYRTLLETYVEEEEVLNLPEWLTSLGVNFLTDVQNLHDYGSFWNEDGLSPDIGKTRYSVITGMIDKGHYQQYHD